MKQCGLVIHTKNHCGEEEFLFVDKIVRIYPHIINNGFSGDRENCKICFVDGTCTFADCTMKELIEMIQNLYSEVK